jgi:hypothetical protein
MGEGVSDARCEIQGIARLVVHVGVNLLLVGLVKVLAKSFEELSLTLKTAEIRKRAISFDL